jgi:hypothetical protein
MVDAVGAVGMENTERDTVSGLFDSTSDVLTRWGPDLFGKGILRLERCQRSLIANASMILPAKSRRRHLLLRPTVLSALRRMSQRAGPLTIVLLALPKKDEEKTARSGGVQLEPKRERAELEWFLQA